MSIDPTHPVPPQFKRLAGMDHVPPHVPKELIRSAGITFAPDFLAAPHDFMAGMHEKFPRIFYDVTPFQNMWTLIGHEDAQFMLRHPEYFSNEGATPFPRDPEDYFYFIPIEIDPPDHRKYRAILDPVFSPQAVAQLEDNIRKLANELIDECLEKGECEFTTAFGRPLPVSVFLDLMGLPQEKRDTFVTWACDLLHSNDPEIMARTMDLIGSYLKEVIEEKRNNPDGRVISRIVHAEFDDRPIHPKEVFGFVIFLFIGGLDTVFATMNNIWLWLANNPDRRQEIIGEPENIANQLEELLRVFSVTFSGRMIREDIEMHGVKMKRGDRITACLPAANYDPQVFINPREVDFHRPRKPVLAFAGGVHSCMGAHLARLEIKIGIQEWLRRIPGFSVKPDAKIMYRPGGVVGPDTLPLVW